MLTILNYLHPDTLSLSNAAQLTSSSRDRHYDQRFVAVLLGITCLGPATHIDLQTTSIDSPAQIAFSFGLIANLLVQVVDTFDFITAINHSTILYIARLTITAIKDAITAILIAVIGFIGKNPFFPRVFFLFR